MAQKLASRESLPTGTVTFLFSDIVGSTPHWEHHPELMEESLKLHNDILFDAIQAHGGRVFKLVGDEFQVAFSTAPQAFQAAINIQRSLQEAEWNELGPIKIRIGLHTGEAYLDDIGDEYAVSPTKNRVGRIRSAAHGGQILLSRETADLCEPTLPEGVTLIYLGEFRMKGLTRLEPLYQAVAPGMPERFPPLATLTAPKNNLPLELTSFIGREREIEEVVSLLEKRRLVTLTGVGGTGKTRLSLKVAEVALDRFPQGVWFAELAGLAGPDLVPRTIVSALGLQESISQTLLDQLKTFLHDRTLLIVLDNCEHILDDCTRTAQALLLTCPGLKIMATSREALGVPGEFIYHVPSLTIPDPNHIPALEQLKQNPSIRLFEERAQAAKSDFAITVENAPAVVQVCCRLDGIPLAIELAAARVNVLSVKQIAEHLDNRFRLLTGGSRTAVPRQQTLRASIDWSYSLLSEQERLLLIRLSVFQGGWTLALAEAVCAFDGLDEFDVLDRLASLVSKSLLIAETGADGDTRYHRLETIRQYAREKLLDSGQSDVLYNRHLDAFVVLGSEAETHLRGHGHLAWLDRLELELDNLRVALTWALEREVVKGLRLANSLHWFWHCRAGALEGAKWAQRLLDRVEERAVVVDSALLSESLARQSMLNAETQQGLQNAKKALRLAEGLGEPHKRILALALLAMAGNAESEKNRRKFTLECLEVAETIGDNFLISESHQKLSRTEPDQAKAKASIDRWVGMKKALGDQDGLIHAHWNLGDFNLDTGEFSKAIQEYEEAIHFAQKLRQPFCIVGGEMQMGFAFQAYGEVDKAIETYQRVLEAFLDLDKRPWFLWGYIFMGYLLGLKRDWLHAEVHFQSAVEISRASNLDFWEPISYFQGAEVARMLGKDDTALQYYARVVELSQGIDSTALIGTSSYASGMIALIHGDRYSAEAYFMIALKDGSEKGDFFAMAACLEAFVLCEIQGECSEKAVRLHGTAASCRGWRIYSQPYLQIASLVISGEVKDALEPVRAALGESRYDELLQEGQAVPVEDVVAYVQEVLDR